MKNLILSALLLATASASAQVIKVPAEIKGAPGAWIIVAPEVVEGGKPKWRIDRGLEEVPLDLLLPPEVISSLRGKVFQSTVPGQYKIEIWNAKGDVPSDIYTCWVIIGTPPPPPPPPNPPIPPVPPVVAGPRVAVLIRESSRQTTKMADLIRDLRNPAHAAYQYLKSNGHRFDIIDPDQSSGGGGNLYDVWKPYVGSLTLPVLLIYDPKGPGLNNSILSKESLSADVADPNVIIQALKKVGG